MFSKEIEIVITLLQNISNSWIGSGDGDGDVVGCDVIGCGGGVEVVVMVLEMVGDEVLSASLIDESDKYGDLLQVRYYSPHTCI